MKLAGKGRSIRRSRHWRVAGVLVSLTLALGVLAASASGEKIPHSPAPDPGARTRDCTTQASLAKEGRSVVRYVVWCGVQAGRVTLRIRRAKGTAPLGFSHLAQAVGPGAAGALRCRPMAGGRVFCSGH